MMMTVPEKKRGSNHASINGRAFSVGDSLRARGVPVRVAYLDGDGGMVVVANEDLPTGRFKTGSVVSMRGRRFAVVAVHGIYLTLRGR